MDLGETNLSALLRSLHPVLHDESFVFGTLKSARAIQEGVLHPIATIQEAEGLSVILTQAEADSHGVPYHGVFRRITLEVHSSLTSVGLTAAISTRLAAHQIPANIVAGTFHDHVFVPESVGEETMVHLRALSSEASSLLRD